MVTEEDAEKANDFIRDHADELGAAKAARVYLEDFRKSKKARNASWSQMVVVARRDLCSEDHS